MCVYVGSEVVLANVLSCKNSVSEVDLENYHDKIIKYFNKEGSKDLVHIALNSSYLENVLIKYDKEFRYFRGSYFANRPINLKQFNSRFDAGIATALEQIAATL